MSELTQIKLSTIKQLFTGMGLGAAISKLEVKSLSFNQEFTPNFDTHAGKKLLKTLKAFAEVELLIDYAAGYSIVYNFHYESIVQSIDDNNLSDKEIFIDMIKNSYWQANFFSKPDYKPNSIMINDDCDETLIDDIRNLSQLKDITIQPAGNFSFLAARGDLVVSPNQRSNAEILMTMEAVLTKDDGFGVGDFAGSISVELDKKIRSQLLSIIG